MSQQKLKLLATTTPEKPRPQPPFVQLTQEQLEAIAGGGFGGDDEGDTGNHNQSLVSLKELVSSPPPPEKSRPQQPLVQLEGKLTEAQLKAIAGGLDGGETGNHNQSLVSLKEGMMSPPPPEKPRPQQPLVQLTQEQLEAIAGGIIYYN